MTSQFIYKTIDIPDYDLVHTQLVDHVMAQAPQFTETFSHLDLNHLLSNCTHLTDWFHNMGLSVRACALILQPPGADQRGLHTDTQRDLVALNIGINNITDTYTAFYRVTGGSVQRKTLANGQPWDHYEGCQLEEIARYDLIKPTWINTSVPHAVHNPTQNTRITVSFRFHQRPLELLGLV